MPRPARFVVALYGRNGSGGYRWALVRSDGHTLLLSEPYSRRDAAIRAVERARAAIAAAKVEA